MPFYDKCPSQALSCLRVPVSRRSAEDDSQGYLERPLSCRLLWAGGRGDHAIAAGL